MKDPNVWWGSANFKEMDERLKHEMSGNLNNSPYSIGFDFAQMFTFNNYAMGVIAIKSEDLSQENKACREWHKPLMLIPGPAEPRCMTAYWKILVEDFHVCGNEGFEVTPAGRKCFNHY
jgi:hypothetical protein